MNYAFDLPSLFRSTRTREDAARRLFVEARRVLKLRLRVGTRIQAESGRVWLTEPGDPDDHFIGSNDCHIVKRGGWIVIECDSDVASRLRIGR